LWKPSATAGSTSLAKPITVEPSSTSALRPGSFDRHLVFDYTLVAHEGDTSWIEPALLALKADLDREGLPASKESCEMCQYVEKRGGIS